MLAKWFLCILIVSGKIYAQDETLYDGALYSKMSTIDAEAIAAAFERRVLIPPRLGSPGRIYTFGLNFKSTPQNDGTSEMAREVAALSPIIPSADLGFDWTTERQRIFLHGFYIPYVNIAASPIDLGQSWAAFGQDLLLAQSETPGRGLIFSYRFGYSLSEMTRQFSVEDSVNLAFFDANSLTSELSLGWHLSAIDLLIYGLAGSVNNSASERDYYNDSAITATSTDSYLGFGVSFCFRKGKICAHGEFHSNKDTSTTYGGSFYVRK